MQRDSDIIHYTTWSINNESPISIKGIKNRKPSSSVASFYSNSKSDTHKSKRTLKQKLKHELKSFCCFLCFLTVKSCKFHSVIMYMILLSFMALFTQMIQGGYLSAIMTSLQTQFNLSTSKIGIILSCFDIMGVFATPLVSYIGSKYNKCRIIGICGIFYVFGSVIYTLPYFLGEKYVIKGYNPTNLNSSSSQLTVQDQQLNNIEVCKIKPQQIKQTTSTRVILTENSSIVFNWTDLSLNSSSSENSQDPLSCNRDFANQWPYYVFIIGQLFMSIGAAPLFSLGITYLCDNLEERKHASYTGIIYGAFALGPAIGYVTASFLLSKWVYLFDPAPVTEKDPRWVGCWFLGFLIAAGLVFIISILLISFPDTLTHHTRAKKAKKKLEKLIKAQSQQQSPPINSTPSSDSTNSKESNNPKRVLHTIDEDSEAVANNFEFLDSVSERLPPSTTNLDSISTISFSNSNITFPSLNTPQSVTPLPSLVPSEESSNITLTSRNKKKICSERLISKIKNSRLKFKGFLASFLKLILNLRYTLLVLIMSVECILVATFTNYMILYSQNVYQISSSRSSILVGGVIVPSAILGAILGGLIVRKFNLYIEGCVRLIILSSIVVVGGIFVLLFIRCEGTPSTGIDLSKQSFNTTFVECNKNCNCESTYSPTCGLDKVTYVSPCFAGCKYSDTKGYYDCSCIQSSAQDTNSTLMATTGACSRNCDLKLIIFLIVLFIVVAFESLSLTPATMLILKLIDKPLQPFALGVLRCANILLAYIPAPIILSQVIDKTCILWNNQCIGDKGTCLEYNSFDFHFVLFGASAGIKIVSCVILLIFTLYIHKSFILRRKYRSKATLNHDPTNILSPKQKYRIDSVVASSDESSLYSDTTSIRTLYRKNKTKQPPQDRSNGIVLKKHTVFEDNFSSLEQSQTSDFFTNLAQSSQSSNRDCLKLNLNNINRPNRQESIEINDSGL